MKKKLGELLMERRLITPAQLTDALTLQRRNGMRLGAALVSRGHLNETQLVTALGEILGVKVVNLAALEPDPAAVRMVPKSFASANDLLPFVMRRDRGRTILTVAMSDPLNYRVVDELGFMTNSTIVTMLGRASDIDGAIRKHYGARDDLPMQGRAAPMRLNSDISHGEMTILRPGGGEEKVNTETGPIPSPFIQPAGAKLEPTVGPAEATPERRQPPPRDDSAMLLTEEVSESTPISPLPSPAPIPKPIPLTSVKRPVDTQFDASLGALIDAAGDAVNAESFQRLERKFWALMRVLAKKGVVTNDDFLKELGEGDDW